MPEPGRLTLPAVPDAELIDVPGTAVAVRRRGHGPPLLYLHGAGMGGKWLRLHESLAREADVIAPDHPGCGDTPGLERLREIADLAPHYANLCRAPGLGLAEPFDVVGYSLGGWIAAEFAAAFPHLVRSLILIAPIGLAVPGRPALAVDPLSVSRQELAALLYNDFSGVGEIARPAAQPGSAVAGGAPGDVPEQWPLYARLSQRPYSTRLPRLLPRVTCPALVVTGSRDRFVPAEVARRYLELLPDARPYELEDAGHALVLERPDAVAAAILGFTASVRRSTVRSPVHGRAPADSDESAPFKESP